MIVTSGERQAAPLREVGEDTFVVGLGVDVERWIPIDINVSERCPMAADHLLRPVIAAYLYQFREQGSRKQHRMAGSSPVSCLGNRRSFQTPNPEDLVD